MAFRVQRLPSSHPAIAMAARIAAVITALLITALMLKFAGHDPLNLAHEVISSSLTDAFGLQDLGVLCIPLILTGLSVAVGLQIGAWNIGAEGQFYAGAFAATAIGLFIPAPDWLSIIMMIAGGLLAGAIWILVPTLAKAYADVNELISTLVLNFVAALLVYYVATGPWRDRVGMANSSTAAVPAEIPEFWGIVHWGLPGAVLLAVGLSLLLSNTKWGYEVRLSGSNPSAAKYAGIPVRRHLITVMLLSGAIAGLAGMLEVAGTVHRLQGGISNNFGYIGIMVAVLARGSMLGVILAGAFMAFIQNSGIILQTEGLTTSAVLAMTGLILFLTAIGEELSYYRITREKI
jgi:general nucleoside transport system permease protein